MIPAAMRIKIVLLTTVLPAFLLLEFTTLGACGNGIKAVESDSETAPPEDSDADSDTDADADTDEDTSPNTDDDVQVDLTGRTYDIDLAGPDITWRSPSAGPTLITMLQTDHLVLMVEAAGSQIDTVSAAAMVLDRGLTPYPCAAAFDFPPTPFSANPAFLVGPLDAALVAGSTSVPLYDLAFGGSFNPDGSEIAQLEVSALIDSRPISSSQGIDVCAALPSFGDECVACPDGEVACIALDVSDASAPWQTDLTVDANIDPSNDPHCN